MGRGLNFLHAYSTAEARQVLLHSRKRIAVILLERMDEDNAGLQLVSYIRNTLELKDVRIILRTGQAGYAPEMDAIRDYDINDCKKQDRANTSETVHDRHLCNSILRTNRAISASRRGLELIIKASAELMGLKDPRRFSETIIEYVVELADNDGSD